MRDQFDFVTIADTVSDTQADWGGPANRLYNEVGLLRKTIVNYSNEHIRNNRSMNAI